MLATAFFGVTAMAFSQQVDYGPTGASDETSFGIAAEYLPFFLEDITYQAEYCRNVNFPSCNPKGQRVCGVSMFSRFRPHLVPLNRREEQDVAQLEQGYITISRLHPKTFAGNAHDHGAEHIQQDGKSASVIL